MSKREHLKERLQRAWREAIDRLSRVIPPGRQPQLAPRRVRHIDIGYRRRSR